MRSPGRPRACRAPRVLGAIASVATVAVVLSACGVPTQPSALPISTRPTRTRLPDTHPVEPCTKSGCINVDVYFVMPNGHLSPAARVVPPHVKLTTVVAALLDGPTPPEQVKGVVTALGRGIHLTFARVTGNSVTLDFTADFGALSGAQEVLGVAQVVYTVTSFSPGVGVTFEIAGATIDVPVETGVLWNGPVHESQYAALLTTTTVPTTTTTT